MPNILPTYPSFSLVITEAYLQMRPSTLRPDLPLPPRYHPYVRPTPQNFLDDRLMIRVDYRYSSPPHPGSLSPALASETSAAKNVWESDGDCDDNESEDSDFFALNSLEVAVRGRVVQLVQRRPSLSTLVVDLSLKVKEKCKKLVASTTIGSRTSTVTKAPTTAN